MDQFNIILVALYRYRNFPVRIIHPLIEKISGVKAHTIFFKNCESNISSLPSAREEELFAGIIRKLNPRLTGFSVLSPYAPVAKRLTRIVKENSSSLVIWGGVHPTIFPENCIEDADMLCIGEGEGAITDLVQRLKDNKPYHSVNNLWIREGGRIIKNSLNPLIQDLSGLPYPLYGKDSYYFIDSNKLSRKDPLLSDRYFWVQTSRGCLYSCSYCVNGLLRPIFNGLGSYSRRRSVTNVIGEIKENLSLPKSKTGYIFFVDEVFGNEEKWLKEFETEYKNEIGLPFYVEYNPKNINSVVLEKLVNAGLDTIHFGIQTGSDHIRNHIFNRPGKNEEILEVIRQISVHNVTIKCDLILNNPYDTEESLENTVNFLLRMPKKVFFNLFSLQYFPNYPLTKRAVEDGYIKPEDASVDRLFEKTTKSWAFVPRLFPCTRKQVLQNIIWLVANKHVKPEGVKFAVSDKTLFSSIYLPYLNLKAVFLGKVLGVGGLVWRFRWLSYLINGIKYIIRLDFRTLFLKLKKHASVSNEGRVS